MRGNFGKDIYVYFGINIDKVQLFLKVNIQFMGYNSNIEFCIYKNDLSGPGGSSGRTLGYGLNGADSIPGIGAVELFLHSVSRLVLESILPL